MSDLSNSGRQTSEDNRSDRKGIKDTPPIGRRNFLLGAGTVVAAGLAPDTPAQAQSKSVGAAAAPGANDEALLTLTSTEAAFISAAVDTLIPADELTPSGSDCRACGFHRPTARRRLRQRRAALPPGPFLPGKPEHGYQLRAHAARVLPRRHRGHQRMDDRRPMGKDFDRLKRGQRDRGDEGARSRQGRVLGAFKSSMFFDQLLQLTMEGFFADPIYGGNRDKVALEDDRLPRPAGELSRRDQDLFQQEISTPSRNPSRTFREGERAMVTVLKEVDAVVVGMGWTGSILSRELTKAGLNGGRARARRDAQPARGFRDSLHSRRAEIFAAPGAVPGFGAGNGQLAPRAQRDRAADAAAGLVRAREQCRRRGPTLERLHWRCLRNRLSCCKSHYIERYGAQASFRPSMTIQDFGVTYAELEPYYDKFEKLCGVSGTGRQPARHQDRRR